MTNFSNEKRQKKTDISIDSFELVPERKLLSFREQTGLSRHTTRGHGIAETTRFSA